MKIDLPYVHAPKVKGRVYTYYRRGGLRLPIEGEVGSDQWLGNYRRIHESFETPGAPKTSLGTLAHVIRKYRTAPEFKQLSPKSREDYGRYLDKLAKSYGHLPVVTMPREFVRALRDKHAKTPRTANYLVAVLRLVLSFAEDQPRTFGLPPTWQNPARRPKLLKTGDGHRPWEEHQIKAFRETWSANTVERVGFELYLNTGQRGVDVIAMSRFHYNRGSISVCQSKTGARLEIPASKDLRAVLDPWLASHDHVVILVTKTGRPFKIDHLRHMMREAYREAGLPDDCTSHGLRYTAAAILEELGFDWQTIGAITGHATAEMVRKYTAQKRRATIAITRLDAARRAQKKNAKNRKV